MAFSTDASMQETDHDHFYSLRPSVSNVVKWLRSGHAG